ncbi:hypothetical protein SAMN04488498_12744 [Mesorhizobium albiziae]|uniref:Uncharacterized protein n=1 Tax=Neomesorhizobium albiziae TaxID=335020 RepID=A0A1I4ELE0_9HYPH|nr:hypothetical protein [Mesorhizobium albiziae]GLS34398.1 hypothetical protein GCM10007937_61130 [Mesorhizobium albiziae]SFL06099.1 hypothetical protein SAMN04488498_12744 [Mesorhizobium albiziae]
MMSKLVETNGVFDNMKRLLSTVLFTMILATPTLAQTTTTGGGASLPVQNSKGSGTLKDTTSHTTHSNGVVVSTSTGSDGQPNGGSGGGGNGGGGANGGTAGGGAGDSKEGH